MSIDRLGKTGRRPGTPGSREAILVAARTRFASLGFEGATMRGIAGDAGVDPALIRHFFGDKEGLFAATLDLPVDIAQGMVDSFIGGREGLGARVAEHYLGVWEDPEIGGTLSALIRTALGNHDQAMHRFREFILATVARDAAGYVAQDRPQLRLTLAFSQLLGLAMARHVVQVPPLSQQSLSEVVAAIAPTLDHCFFGDLASTRSC